MNWRKEREREKKEKAEEKHEREGENGVEERSFGNPTLQQWL